MKRLLLAAMSLLAPAVALAGPYGGSYISTTAGKQYDYQAGTYQLAGSSVSISTTNPTVASTFTITLNGATGAVTATTYYGDASHMTSLSSTTETNTFSSSKTLAGTPISLYAAGNVGIGTTNATSPLDIQANGPQVKIDGEFPSYPQLKFYDTGTQIFQIDSQNSGGTLFSAIYGGGGVYLKLDPRTTATAGIVTQTVNSFTANLTSTTFYAQFGSGPSQFIATSSGNVTALSSVTANAFFGDGSHLTGVISSNISYSTNTNNTWAGSQVFQATVSVTGVFIPNAVPSTFTVITADYRSDTSEPTCLANSTVTFTTDQAAYFRVDAQLTIETYNGNNNHCSFLFDSKYDGPFSTSKPMFQANFSAANRTDFPVTASYITQTSFVAGSHSVCLTCNGDTGGARGLLCTGAPCVIRVTELR